jgi:predicted TIM-barrel fold metal-dependent hydrolase
VIDAHVHIFPEGIFMALWKWFDENAWHIRYQMNASEVIKFLLDHGIRHVVALQYAHRPGISRELNEYMLQICKNFQGKVTGMATVFPGEKDAKEILVEAFERGLKGVKLHAHVQCFDINADYMYPIYECSKSYQRPIIMHAGREPKSDKYDCDPYEICNAQKLEAVLKAFPDLKVCVPHLGFDELREYRELIERHDNLWLDTTMVLANYFPSSSSIDLGAYRIERVMYGSDFPNIPYAWDRELKALAISGLGPAALERVCHKNAQEFFGIEI